MTNFQSEIIEELENLIIDFSKLKSSGFKEWKLMIYSNKEIELLNKLAKKMVRTIC